MVPPSVPSMGGQLRWAYKSAASRFFPARFAYLQRGRTLRVTERFQFSHLFGERLQPSILRFPTAQSACSCTEAVKQRCPGRSRRTKRPRKGKMQGAQRKKGGSERGSFFIAASSFENNEKAGHCRSCTVTETTSPGCFPIFARMSLRTPRMCPGVPMRTRLPS